jgi:Gamma tubulin complex component C-terminal
MLAFIQQLSYFCTNEVIEPNWINMQASLEKVKTVDELMQDHIDFLDTCLKECMLTNARLLRVAPHKSSRNLTMVDSVEINDDVYDVCNAHD